MKGNKLLAALGKDFAVFGKSFGFDVAKNKTDDDVTLNESYSCWEDIPEITDLAKLNNADALRTIKERDSLHRTSIRKVNNARNAKAGQSNTKVAQRKHHKEVNNKELKDKNLTIGDR